MVCEIALGAVQTVLLEDHGRKEIDLKKYAKVGCWLGRGAKRCYQAETGGLGRD
jgi:hypothetical protein